MRGTRAKALMTEARKRGRDGSVIIGREYKRLKKTHVHPHYSKNTMESGVSTDPERMFRGGSILNRRKAGHKAGMENFN